MKLALLLFALFNSSPAQSPDTSAQRGVEARTFHDTAFNRERKVWIYTPRGYDPNRATPYDLIIMFDGADYLQTMPLPRMLDTLKLPPMVAVLIDDGDRGVRTAELGNSARFNNFLATQLLPWVRTNWHVTHDPQRTIIGGSSAGGLAAASAAFAHPELFGNVLSQSGAFWRGNEGSSSPFEWLTAQYAASPKKNIRFFMDVGALENHAVLGGSGPVMTEANERLRDVLVRKGYDVVFTEVPGGVHAPESWVKRLPAGLLWITSRWN